MKFIIPKSILFLIIHISFTPNIGAQKYRTQYPKLLQNAYFEINIGYINYPFSNDNLLNGYTADNVDIPHTAVRIIPFGYNFNDYLSAQVSYMRPVYFPRYNGVKKEDGESNDVGRLNGNIVFMNIGGITLKGQYPIYKNFNLFGEAGLGIITRSSITSYSDEIVMEGFTQPYYLFGGGMKYKYNDNWDFNLSTVYSPPYKKKSQPHTAFCSAGFTYNMRAIPQKKVIEHSKSTYFFPKNIIQLGYTTNAFGYGVNDFLSDDRFPVFWGGTAEVKRGITLHYQRNAYHGRKYFSLDWGVSYTHNTSNINEDKFWTLSIYPLFRFTLVHTKYADFFFNYSLAGPSYISGENIDDEATGPHFTFQDFMGIGVFAGEKRQLCIESRIAHYSNGNIYTDNSGVKIPLTFNLGYTFD